MAKFFYSHILFFISIFIKATIGSPTQITRASDSEVSITATKFIIGATVIGGTLSELYKREGPEDATTIVDLARVGLSRTMESDILYKQLCNYSTDGKLLCEDGLAEKAKNSIYSFADAIGGISRQWQFIIENPREEGVHENVVSLIRTL